MLTPIQYVYAYPHPAIATDIVVFGIDEGKLGVLLIKRGEEPFKGAWALPGGFLQPDETIEACARRELLEETGLSAEVRLVGLFSEPMRDPRERVVSAAYLACVDYRAARIRAGSDAAHAGWHLVAELPELAFDHAAIIAASRNRVRELAEAAPIATRLIPQPFTLAELQAAQEALLGRPLDKRNFRRDITARQWAIPANAQRRGKTRSAGVFATCSTNENDD